MVQFPCIKPSGLLATTTKSCHHFQTKKVNLFVNLSNCASSAAWPVNANFFVGARPARRRHKLNFSLQRFLGPPSAADSFFSFFFNFSRLWRSHSFVVSPRCRARFCWSSVNCFFFFFFDSPARLFIFLEVKWWSLRYRHPSISQTATNLSIRTDTMQDHIILAHSVWTNTPFQRRHKIHGIILRWKAQHSASSETSNRKTTMAGASLFISLFPYLLLVSCREFFRTRTLSQITSGSKKSRQ